MGKIETARGVPTHAVADLLDRITAITTQVPAFPYLTTPLLDQLSIVQGRGYTVTINIDITTLRKT